jgi:hypothetical protein
MRAVYIERRVQAESKKYLPDKTIKRLSELPAAVMGL